MKMNLKYLALCTAVVGLTGCLNVKGTLTANESILLKNTDNSQVAYTAKKYPGTVSVSAEEHNLVLDLGSGFFKGNKKFVFKNSGQFKINDIRSGEKVYLTAADSGQIYDLEVLYSEQEKAISGILTETRECTQFINNQFVSGKQVVKFRKISRTTAVEASLISPKIKKVVATFNGSEVKEEEVNIPDFHDECK